MHRPIAATARQQEISWVELNTADRVDVMGEVLQHPPDTEVPDFYRSVLSTRRDPLTVRTEFGAVHGGLVAVVGINTPFFAAIPNFNRAVCTTRYQQVTIRVKIHTTDPEFVSVERPDELGRLQVPDFEGTSAGSGTDELFYMVELDAVDRSGVSAEAHEAAFFADGPKVDLFVVAAGDHDAAGLVTQGDAVHRCRVGDEVL